MHGLRRSLATLVLAVAASLLLILGARLLRARATDHFRVTQRYEDIYYLPPPRWLSTLSLGWDEALADLLWIRALVYFGEELKQRGQVRHVFDYAEAIVTLDPYFLRAYRWVGTTGMYRPTHVSVEDVRRAVSYLERATAVFPDHGELAWDTGASLAYELAPLIEDSDEKARIRARGVEHMMTATRLGAAPPWQVLTNTTHLLRLGQTDAAIRHLEEMYATTSDPSVRSEIEARLTQLRSAAHAEAVRGAWRELEEERRRNYPYLDPTLYLLVGPRDAGAD